MNADDVVAKHLHNVFTMLFSVSQLNTFLCYTVLIEGNAFAWYMLGHTYWKSGGLSDKADISRAESDSGKCCGVKCFVPQSYQTVG